MHEILLNQAAQRQLKTLEKAVQDQIKKRLFLLKESPNIGKRLDPSRFLSLCCGDYRAIYEISPAEEKIVVLLIGHRKNVYENFSRWL